MIVWVAVIAFVVFVAFVLIRTWLDTPSYGPMEVTTSRLDQWVVDVIFAETERNIERNRRAGYL